MSERNYYVICDDNCKFPAMTKEEIITAITEATGTEPTDIDSAFITKIKELNEYGTLKWWVGTQAEYNALAEKDPYTLYIITDGNDLEELEAELKSVADSLADMQGNVTDLQENVTELQKKALRYAKSFSTKSFDNDCKLQAYFLASRVGEVCTLTALINRPANEAFGPTTMGSALKFQNNFEIETLCNLWNLKVNSAHNYRTFESIEIIEDETNATARLVFLGNGEISLYVKLPNKWEAKSADTQYLVSFIFNSYAINKLNGYNYTTGSFS